MNFLSPYHYHCDSSPYAHPEYLMDNHRPSTSGVKYQQNQSPPILQPLYKPPEKKPVEFHSLFSVLLMPSLEKEKKK